MSVASPDTSAAPPLPDRPRRRVAVIGAGASGLASLKECLAEGLDVVCFDQEPQVGGLWRYVPQGGDDTHSSVYMSTIINTSKEMMAYSDFPAPKEWPTFLPHRFVVKYLNSYCDHFKLREHIKFNRKVISVSPETDEKTGENTGKWEIVTQKVRRKQAQTNIYGVPPTPAMSPDLSAIRPPLPPRPVPSIDVPDAVDGRRPRSTSRGRHGNAQARILDPILNSSGDTLYSQNNVTSSTLHRVPSQTFSDYDPAAGYEPIPERSHSTPPDDIVPAPDSSRRSLSQSRKGLLAPSSASQKSGGKHDGESPHKSYGGRFRSVSRVRSKCETFDYVIIATGHHWKPKLPEFKGMENFEGGMLHSHSYKVPYPFKDQRVLIVGIGNSGADIATELSHHAKQVILSARSGQWILPRSSLFGVPLDHLSTRLAASLPRPLTNYLFETAMKFQNGDLSRFGLKPKHGIFDAHPTVNGHILDRIAAGKILVRPNVAEFAATTSTSTGVPRTNTVVFEDGTVEQIDQVIYCTGYKIEHPFLSPQTSLDILGRERPDSNRVRLYKNVFPVFHKNIAFVGLVQPIGAVMPVSEMQARWVSRVFSGNPTQTPLPSPTQMRDEVDINWTHNYKPTHVLTERHTIQVDFVSYMDDIATQIGCKPDLWGLVRGKEFVLASQILLGPAVPAQYRVNGPGRWEGAKGVIADACGGVDFTKVAGYKAVERLREREKRGEKGAGADETAHDALVR